MVAETSVGIDYHKDSLQVCVMDKSGKVHTNRKIGNDIEATIKLIGQRAAPVVIAAEACNGSASFLDELHQKTYVFSYVFPSETLQTTLGAPHAIIWDTTR